MATIDFEKQSVLIGPNNCGKSTIIDALALVLGRDRMVRNLTEHDFYGSNPNSDQRIKIVVTLVGFENNDPDYNLEWFREGRAVPKWYDPNEKVVEPEKNSPDHLLAAQIAFFARFDWEDLTIESIRCFYDDDSIEDPFDDELVVKVPSGLLSEIGFFLVPTSRTWEKMISFGSELFKRVITNIGQVPGEVIIKERDRLRNPDTPLDSTKELGEMVNRINQDLSRLFPQHPKLQLRLTRTDCESLLETIIPHYELDDGFSLPASRHGTGILSLQTIMLLLEYGRFRIEQGKNLIIAVEEPEIHLPPGLQRILLHRIESVTDQSITTTHSPNIAAYYRPTEVFVLSKINGELKANPLVEKPLTHDTCNGVRKLLRDNRFSVVSALMHEYLIIPEGRIDFEWLQNLTTCVEVNSGGNMQEKCEYTLFGCVSGIIPTQDSAILPTFEVLSKVKSDLVVLVDGDSAGDEYIEMLIEIPEPPRCIIQWARGWVIEDVVFWILEPKIEEFISSLSNYLGYTISSKDELKELLKNKSGRDRLGIKGDYQAYEFITGEISEHKECVERAKELLDSLSQVILYPEKENKHYTKKDVSSEKCSVLVWKP